MPFAQYHIKALMAVGGIVSQLNNPLRDNLALIYVGRNSPKNAMYIIMFMILNGILNLQCRQVPIFV